jgi:hypothetical protein
MNDTDLYQNAPETEPLIEKNKESKPWWKSLFDDTLSESELKWLNIIFLIMLVCCLVSNTFSLYEYYKLSTTSDLLLMSFKPIQYPLLIVDNPDDIATINYPLQKAPFIYQRN